MRVFLRSCCSCSLVLYVAVKSWRSPPLELQVEVLEVHLSPLRANPPARRARRRTRKKTKKVLWSLSKAQLSLELIIIKKKQFNGSFLNVPVVFSAGDGAGSQEDQLCTALVSQLNRFADKETLIQFLRCFLLESNSSSVRWQAHCLTLHIYRYLATTFKHHP